MAARRRREEPAASIGQRHDLANFPAHIKQLGEIILDGKKDIKFHRTAESRDGAIAWGRKRDYHIGPEDDDINHDGIPDVVLYTRDGTPVVINGWELVKTESKIREKYARDTADPMIRARIGGLTNYKKRFYESPGAAEFVQGIEGDERFGSLYALPKRPAAEPRRQALYSRFTAMVVPAIQAVINAITPSGKSGIKSCVSAISVASMFYIEHVLGALWNHADNEPAKVDISAKTEDPVERHKLFTRYLGTIPDAASTQYESLVPGIQNELSPDNIRDVLATLGYDGDLVEEGPLDNQKTPEARVWKLQSKNMITEQLEVNKTETIRQVFSA